MLGHYQMSGAEARALQALRADSQSIYFVFIRATFKNR
jgi:hypothetical protein